MAWWDTLISGANTLGNIYNAAKPFINTGAAIYDRNQTRGAISDAFGQYKGYADKSLGALGQVYDEGRQATAPYRAAGQSGLAGYMNLLNDPSQIRNDPGYQWRTNQGAEAVTRKAASNRLLGSGNFATALQDYGQNQATAELDSALNRQVPLMQAGQTATGQLMDAGRNFATGTGLVNLGIGEAASGAAVGGAAANSGMLRALLGEADSQGGTLSNLGSNINTANNLNTLYGQFSNAGNGSALAGAQEVASQTGQGTWGDLMTGPRTSAQMPAGNTLANAGQWGTAAELAAGTQALLGAQTGLYASGPGSQAAMLAAQNLGLQGATTATTEALAANMAAQGGTAAAGGAGGGTAGAYGAGWLAAPAIMVAALKWLDSVNWGKGGASESAKLPKMQNELTRRMQADPSGNSAKQFIDSIITNKQWANESNQDELGTLFKAGMVSLDTFPTLHSSESIVDLWNHDLTADVYNPNNDPDASNSLLTQMRYLNNPQVLNKTIGPQAVAASYGLTREQQQQYESLIEAERQAKSRLESGGQAGEGWRGSMTARQNQQALSAAQSALSQFKSTYLTEPRKKMYASALYDNLRSTGYQGDLSKLQRYLGV